MSDNEFKWSLDHAMKVLKIIDVHWPFRDSYFGKSFKIGHHTEEGNVNGMEITPWNNIAMFKGTMMFISTMCIQWAGDLEKVTEEFGKIANKTVFRKESIFLRAFKQVAICGGADKCDPLFCSALINLYNEKVALTTIGRLPLLHVSHKNPEKARGLVFGYSMASDKGFDSKRKVLSKFRLR